MESLQVISQKISRIRKDTDFPPEQEIPEGLFSEVKDGICGDLRMPIQAILGRAFLWSKTGRPYDIRPGGLMVLGRAALDHPENRSPFSTIKDS